MRIFMEFHFCNWNLTETEKSERKDFCSTGNLHGCKANQFQYSHYANWNENLLNEIERKTSNRMIHCSFAQCKCTSTWNWTVRRRTERYRLESLTLDAAEGEMHNVLNKIFPVFCVSPSPATLGSSRMEYKLRVSMDFYLSLILSSSLMHAKKWKPVFLFF